MHEMHMEPAQPQDIDVVLAWVNSRELWEIDSVEPYATVSKQAFKPKWLELLRNHSIWLMYASTRSKLPIGQVGWVNHDDYAEFFITLAWPRDRGHGFGQQGMSWMENHAVAAGHNRVVGRVLGNNGRALNFFRGIGYQDVGKEQGRVSRAGQTYALYTLEKVF